MPQHIVTDAAGGSLRSKFRLGLAVVIMNFYRDACIDNRFARDMKYSGVEHFVSLCKDFFPRYIRTGNRGMSGPLLYHTCASEHLGSSRAHGQSVGRRSSCFCLAKQLHLHVRRGTGHFSTFQKLDSVWLCRSLGVELGPGKGRLASERVDPRPTKAPKMVRFGVLFSERIVSSFFSVADVIVVVVVFVFVLTTVVVVVVVVAVACC